MKNYANGTFQKLPTTAYSVFKYFFLCLGLSLLLTACDNSSEKQTAKSDAILILNDANIEQFTIKLSNDYFKTLDSLVKNFYAYKKSDDSYGYTQFRNQEWTPAYVEKRDHYLAILDQNRPYLTKTPLKPLFSVYDNMIYIGIGLKNSLLDNDPVLMKQALTTAEQDKKIVRATLTSVGLNTK